MERVTFGSPPLTKQQGASEHRNQHNTRPQGKVICQIARQENETQKDADPPAKYAMFARFSENFYGRSRPFWGGKDGRRPGGATIKRPIMAGAR